MKLLNIPFTFLFICLLAYITALAGNIHWATPECGAFVFTTFCIASICSGFTTIFAYADT